MAIQTPQIITDANVIYEGHGVLGVCKEFKLPVLEREIKNQENAGFVRPVNLGSIKELKIEFTIQKIWQYMFDLFSLNEEDPKSILVKSSVLEGIRSIPLQATFKGIVTKLEKSDLAPKKEVESKVEMACTYYSLVVNNTRHVMVDTDNYVLEINGYDEMANVRAHLN